MTGRSFTRGSTTRVRVTRTAPDFETKRVTSVTATAVFRSLQRAGPVNWHDVETGPELTTVTAMDLHAVIAADTADCVSCPGPGTQTLVTSEPVRVARVTD